MWRKNNYAKYLSLGGSLTNGILAQTTTTKNKHLNLFKSLDLTSSLQEVLQEKEKPFKSLLH